LEADKALRHPIQQLRRMDDPGLERFMFMAGATLLLAVVAEALAVTLLWPSTGGALWRALAVEVVVGREAAFPIALGGGVPAPLLVQVSATQDIGIFCILFPLFLRLMHRRGDSPGWLMTRLRKVQEAAQHHRGFANRWGPWGVFAFMLVPFLVNGPLVGGVMGRLAGIPTKSLLLPVAASTVVAAFAWTYLYDGMLRLAGDLHPALPPALTIAIVSLLVGWLLFGEWRQARKARRERRAEAEKDRAEA
jgi:uncharacterized membrane protein